MRALKKVMILFYIITINIFAVKNIPVVLPEFGQSTVDKPVTLPEFGGTDVPTVLPETDEKNKWILEKNYTVILKPKLNVVVPLEIISDIDIEAFILDDEEANISFDIELNKKPNKENYYKLKYSETEIDIDNDGKIDTFIYSPKYINNKIAKENYVKIKGKNISNDGEYFKRVYITIEVDE